ncbi:MAG: bifunctional adenosylcobinamide kinase/adenosylcobinamide-phosphate guanylyltransferase [Pseudobutyrivibrio sp.]|nr:bifunctional adenosylcobinamide kinase/adenosylcobinamide-phosphate guanylyltransferase [Pseudobutyrivibrio sp.]
MLTLIYGGSSSGKSAFAEDYVCRSKHRNKYYLATMDAKDEESKARVEKHRSLRSGKGFVTLEHSVDVYEALPEIIQIDSGDFSTDATGPHSVVLLECMSNLVANEMFRDGEINSADDTVEKILSDIKELNNERISLVVVSNNVFDDGNEYDVGTKNYLKALGQVNEEIAHLADEVYEVVVGVPVKQEKEA